MQVIDRLISEGVIPYDIGNHLKEVFDEKVNERVETIVEEKTKELHESNEKNLSALMELLKESYEKSACEWGDMVESKVSDYMDLVVENFINENRQAIETQIDSKRINTLLEGFQSMMIASGVELKHIEEEFNGDKKEVEEMSEAQKREVDNLAAEVIRLRQEIETRDKVDHFVKITEGLSSLQKAKLEDYAEKVADDLSLSDFVERIDMMKESIEEATKFKEDNHTTKILESFIDRAKVEDRREMSKDLIFGSSIFKN